MAKLNKRVLELVRDELEKQGRELVGKALVWKNLPEQQNTEVLSTTIRELWGVTSILNLQGPTQALAELTDTVAKTSELTQEQRDSVADIANATVNYLNFLLQREVDNPVLILPEINQLREIAKKPAVNEASVLAHLLPVSLIVNEVSSKSPETRLIVRRARHMYQQGLLHAIKGSSKVGAFRILGHAIRRIQQTMEASSAEALYWLMILQILDAFAKRKLSLDKSRLRSLMLLERQMRVMTTDNTDVTAVYPEATQKQMLALFMLSGMPSEQAQKIAARIGVEAFEFDDTTIKDDRVLFGSEGIHSFADTMSVLKDELDSLSFFIERLEGNQQFDETDKENLVKNLLSIADVSSMTGFAVAKKRFTDHVETLGGLPLEEAIPKELVAKMVDSLLYLECLLLELNNRIPTDEYLKRLNNTSFEQLVESNILRHAQLVVLDESKSRLADVMEKITDLQSGFLESSQIEQLQASFASISGAACMLGLDKAAKISQQCRQIVTSQAIEKLLTTSESMPVLADIIVSLEYYSDNCRWDRSFDPTVLSVADESLETLTATLNS